MEARMSTDLELIEQLKKETGRNLNFGKRDVKDIMPSKINGYSVDANGNVTGLNLRGIKLVPFPVSISKLKNLRHLNLLGTQISDIAFLGGLTNLRQLSLTSNKITDISPLRDLVGLKELYLTSNKITDISPLLGLTNLTRLYLGKNQIRFLPEEFFNLNMEIVWSSSKKTGIHLKDNPIESPPLEIIKKGKDAVNSYFKTFDAVTISSPGVIVVQTLVDKDHSMIDIDTKIDLPALKSDFFELKDTLESVVKDKKLKQDLKDIADNLDELTFKSDEEKYIKPLNKLGRLLGYMGDDKSQWSKALKKAQISVGLPWKLARTYNKFARWLALPQMEKPVAVNIGSNAKLSFKMKKITLKNYRGFENMEFSFSDRFNLFLGDNGSGKTSVLDALALVLSSIFIGLEEKGKSFAIKDGDVRQVSHIYDGEVRMEPNYPVSIAAEGLVMGKTVHWTKNRKGGITQTDDGDWDLTAITENFTRHVREGNPVTLPLIAYYGTGRLWLRKDNEKVDPISPVSRLFAYNDCLDPRSNEKELVRWMKEQELTAIQRKKKSNLYEAVKKAIIDCIEEYKEIWFDFREDAIMVKLQDGQSLPAHYTSDGYRNMIAMVADIASKMSILNPHLGTRVTQRTPGIVLIDELDLHLHPTWQRRVVGDLLRTFPRVQFIATSHSPFIVQSLKSPEELIDLDKGAKTYEKVDMSIEDIAEHIMNVEIPQKSKRYMEMMKTAEQYYKLLEEGKSAENDDELKRIKNKLDELSIPFSDNPVLQAFLKMERTAAGLHETD